MFFKKLQKKLGSTTNTSLTNEIYRNILRNSKIVKKHFSIKELKDKGFNILSIDDYSSGFKENEILGVKYIDLDINHIDQIEIPNALNKRESHNVWKDEKRLMYLDKEITELEYKSLLIKKQKELEFIEETIGFYETISEVCKIYFINKINNLK